jgi:thioester reductase-like protein
MRGSRVLLTGATGVLGSWVLAEALRKGHQPIALMRDADVVTARQRLATVLDLAGMSGGEDRVEIVLGDSSESNLGLSKLESERLLANLDSMIHCAACTSFSGNDDDQVLTTNIGGVRHILELLDGTDVSLYHVSTAYVAGQRQGRVLETDLEHDEAYTNTYEESKNEAEQLVRKAFSTGRIKGSVFRPAIIVGATGTGRICQFTNFYNFMQVLEFAAMARRRGMECFHLNANPTCTKNLAPVDWTAEAMWGIIEAEGASGHTYHLTNPDPPSHEYLAEWGNGILSELGMRIECAPQKAAEGGTFKRAMRGRYEHFEGYLVSEPDFDRTNTDRALGDSLPFPTIDHVHLTRMYLYAREQRWRSIFGKRVKPDRAYTQGLLAANA